MWRRRNKGQESEELREARAALERADQQLQRVQQHGEKVDRISEALNTYIVRNHFGESIKRAFERRAAT